MSRRSRFLLLLIGLTTATAALLIYRRTVSRPILNSSVAGPLVRLFNRVREQAYFSHDQSCLDGLGASRLRFRFTPNPKTSDDCPLRNVVRMLPGGIIRRPLYMTCRLALSLDRFEREVLQPSAARYFGQPVVQLGEFGVRNCRTVEGYRFLLSEHAFANAIDVSGFVLHDGTVVDVARDWNGNGWRAAFLREVSSGACKIFRTVLTPGFDERHGDHLHFDMGLIGGCRASDP